MLYTLSAVQLLLELDALERVDKTKIANCMSRECVEVGLLCVLMCCESWRIMRVDMFTCYVCYVPYVYALMFVFYVIYLDVLRILMCYAF